MVAPLGFLARFPDYFVIHQSGIYFQSVETSQIGCFQRLDDSTKFLVEATYIF